MFEIGIGGQLNLFHRRNFKKICYASIFLVTIFCARILCCNWFVLGLYGFKILDDEIFVNLTGFSLLYYSMVSEIEHTCTEKHL